MLAAIVLPAQGQAVPSDAEVRAILKERVDSARAPGIVVGILENGRRRYISFGSAGAGRAPIDEHTLFEIGSISKTFTGLLLADAVIRGEVRLDQPVSQLFPTGTTIPTRDGKVITLEHLSTHRSGLPRLPTNLAPANRADPYANYDVQRLTAFLAACVLSRAPGDSAEYSNLGAGLLGQALALRASSPSWGALVERRITTPLGMRETFVDVPAALVSRMATGHDERIVPVSGWHFDALAGAGALRSTGADMLRYLAAELDSASGPLVNAVVLGRTPRADFSPGTRIALGWMVSGPPSHPVWWHDGATGGFRSFAAFDPARHVAIIVLANSANAIDDIGRHLMNPQAPLVMPILPPRVALTLSSAALDRLVGEYQLTPALVLTVTRDGDALFAQAPGQARFPLTATASNRFVFPATGIEMVFDLGEAGPARQLTFRQGGGTISGPRRP